MTQDIPVAAKDLKFCDACGKRNVGSRSTMLGWMVVVRGTVQRIVCEQCYWRS